MKSERGSASLEFIAAGVLLIVPLVYLTLLLGRVQAGTLAAQSLARQAVRVYVTAPSSQVGSLRITQAESDTLSDFHFATSDARVSVSCQPSTSPCLRQQAWVTVATTISVTLPFVPSILGLEKFSHIDVSAHATQRVPLGGAVTP